MIKASFITLLLLSIVTSYCPRTSTFSFSTCTFQYAYSDSACTKFQFIQCTYQKCASEKIVNGQTKCQKYQTLTGQSWNYCTKQCCLKYKIYPYEDASVKQCQDEIYATVIMQTVFYIILFVLFLIILAVATCIKFFRDKIEECRQRIKGGRIQSCLRWIWRIMKCKCLKPEEDHPNSESGELIQELEHPPEWQYKTEDQTLDKNCSICSEKGSTVKYLCGHLFHRNCINSSLQERKECPICRLSLQNNIEVYCERCCKGYFVCNGDTLAKSTFTICDKCSSNITPNQNSLGH